MLCDMRPVAVCLSRRGLRVPLEILAGRPSLAHDERTRAVCVVLWRWAVGPGERTATDRADHVNIVPAGGFALREADGRIASPERPPASRDSMRRPRRNSGDGCCPHALL